SYSFSTLLRSNAGLLQEQAASDELEADAPAIEVVQQAQVGGVEHPVHPLLQGLAGVRGAAFGNAVHAVFEHRHPGVPITAQLQLVRASLQEHAVALGELPL